MLYSTYFNRFWNKNKIVEIQFDDEKTAYYDYTELEQIEHSYAITIHKAQRK